MTHLIDNKLGLHLSYTFIVKILNKANYFV